MKKVAFGFLGTRLDAAGGFGKKRESFWRPSIALARDASLGLSRFEIWYDTKFQKLANLVKEDIESGENPPEVLLRKADIKNPWNFEEVYAFLFDFAADYVFRPEEEEYFIHLTTGTHVAQICLFLLAETRHLPARLIQTSPRSDGQQTEELRNADRGSEDQPAERSEKQEAHRPSISIVDLDLARYDKLAQRFERKRQSDLEILKAGINTRNSAFNRLITEIEQVARASTEPILLLGPTGAGKSHLAKQIYQLRRSQHRVDGAFVDINCATIRGEQAMSALFGHVKGAFTGALNRREGLLKKADRGLLFLDEVAELGMDEQAMLLRAIEDRLFLPLGSDKEESSDFQLIVGTNRDLRQRVREGLFREDLLKRMDTWSFVLPGLSERREDIEPNLDFELRKFEDRSGRRITFGREAKRSYLDYALSSEATWDGNFRDLNASVIRLATLAPEGRITEKCVAREVARLGESWSRGSSNGASSENGDAIIAAVGLMPERLDMFERPQLSAVIRTLGESRTLAEAGRKLFGVSRKTREHSNDSDRVRKYLARFGLDARALLRGE